VGNVLTGVTVLIKVSQLTSSRSLRRPAPVHHLDFLHYNTDLSLGENLTATLSGNENSTHKEGHLLNISKKCKIKTLFGAYFSLFVIIK